MESKYYVELKFPNGKILRSKIKPPAKIHICNGKIIESEPVGIPSYGIDLSKLIHKLISWIY